MKKFLLLLFLLSGIFSFAQDKYKVNVYFRFHADGGGRKVCEYWSKITLNFSDGTSEEVYNGQSQWFDVDLSYTRAKKIVSVRGQGYAKRRATIGGCNGDDEDFDRTISVSDCNTSQVSDEGDNNATSIAYTVRATLFPVHSLTSKNIVNGAAVTNTYLPSDDKITITDNDGFVASSYNYQYSLDNISWTDVPSTLYNLHILTLSAKDLLGAGYLQYVGDNIYFRAVSCLNNGTYQSISTPLPLTIIQSAPHILSSTVSPTKCSDTSDGSVTLNFDRTLLTNETLKLSLINTVTGAAVINQDITGDLQTSTSYTLQDLPAGTYKLDLLGTYENNATYTDSPSHTISFEITKPTPVTFSMTSQTNVYCYQGNDGIINLTASGGQNQFQYHVVKDGQLLVDWTNFTSGNNSQISNLAAGTYKIKVRDSNLCVAKENGTEKEITVTITQPAEAIDLPSSEIEVSQPTGYGLSNGYISVRVVGGTPNTGGSYNFEWRKDSPTGTVITAGITTDAVNNPFTIKLDGLAAGNYYLTVKDKNYSSATSQLGNCGIISQEFIMSQPDPLAVTINIQKQISCNIANDYQYKADLDSNGVPDEAEDGILKAAVTGGVGTYTYQWQKSNNGIFQNISGATQATLENLTTGTYKVLIKDVNNNTTDAEYTFGFPATLAITLSANTIACYSQNSGQVSVAATGGTGAYSYQWNTNDTTPTVTGLSAGNYFVLVNDAKNCKVSGSVQIQGPNQLIIDDISVQNPICFGANNGEIKVDISGGKAPYNVTWSNGVTGESNLNIPSGTYTVTVTDDNGCSVFRNYTLTDPAQLTVDLGSDITLCLGDSHTYNVAINDPGATYQWKDQSGNIISTASSIILSVAGSYTVLITDSKGCTATDTVVVKNSSEILNPQFMLTTHAYREATVVLVNTSPTKPQTVEWIVPDTPDIQVMNKTDEFLELKFSQLGSYEIGLKGTQGECEKTFYKKVIVEENTAGVNLNPVKASNIREFTILPNPNNGVFKILVGLDKAAIVNVRIIDMVSHEAYPAVKMTPSTYFTIPYNTSLPAGSYLIIVETGGEVLVKKMLVQ